MKKSKNHKNRARANESPLTVWAERRAEPDWDRYIAALVALGLRRAEERAAKEERG